MVQLRVKELVKEFAGGVRAVDTINFTIPPGSLFTLLGPSGCGKTTTLRLIAGLETPTSGQVFFDNEDYTSYPPFRREIGMVFQSYALFPHMSVYENIAYGLRIRNASNAEIENRVNSVLELVGLPGVSDRKPSQLSGGQQQRIALARAIVYDPKVGTQKYRFSFRETSRFTYYISCITAKGLPGTVSIDIHTDFSEFLCYRICQGTFISRLAIYLNKLEELTYDLFLEQQAIYLTLPHLDCTPHYALHPDLNMDPIFWPNSLLATNIPTRTTTFTIEPRTQAGPRRSSIRYS